MSNIQGFTITSVTPADNGNTVTLEDGTTKFIPAADGTPTTDQEIVIDPNKGIALVTFLPASAFDVPAPSNPSTGSQVSTSDAISAFTAGTTITSVVSGNSYHSADADSVTVTLGELRGQWTVVTA